MIKAKKIRKTRLSRSSDGVKHTKITADKKATVKTVAKAKRKRTTIKA